MFDNGEIRKAVIEIVEEILESYDKHVPECAAFPDLRVGRKVFFGDRLTTMPGRVELVVMNMDKRHDPDFDRMRFLSLRVMKSREGGYASVTCLHGDKAEVRRELEGFVDFPEFLLARIDELSNGLPEETNPDIWR